MKLRGRKKRKRRGSASGAGAPSRCGPSHSSGAPLLERVRVLTIVYCEEGVLISAPGYGGSVGELMGMKAALQAAVGEVDGMLLGAVGSGAHVGAPLQETPPTREGGKG